MSCVPYIKIQKVLILAAVIIMLPALLYSQIIYQGKSYSLSDWDQDVFELSANRISLEQIFGFVDSLGLGVAGEHDTNYISFTPTDTLIYKGTQVLFTFPDEFDLESLASIEYSDNDENNTDFAIDSMSRVENTLRIYLDTTGTAPLQYSKIQFVLNDIVNPTVSGYYQVALAVADSAGRITYGPEVSAPFQVIPGDLDSIRVTPRGVQQIRAGKYLQFDCTCYDSFSNVLECGSKEWLISASNITGEIDSTGLFWAKYVGPFHVNCQVGGLIDSSDQLFVVAGDLYTFNMTGFPDTITAGETLPNSIYVEAKDFYSNRVRSYLGDVWFESSDTAAELLNDSLNKYIFQEADQGDKVFGDTAFIFNTAGMRTIKVTNGLISSPLKYIIVEAGLTTAVQYSIPDTVIAGQPFSINISGMSDISGNLLSGFVNVVLEGNGTAPDGSLPIINSVYVSDGSGSASQTLYKSGNADFTISIDTITITPVSVYVKNAGASRFDFSLGSPQIVGVPFTSPARLTALDKYENIVKNFNANVDTITISPWGDGAVTNGIIGSSQAFQDGICNLVPFQVSYSGPERFLKFRARSKSGVQGTSETVEMNSSKIELISLSTSSLYRGDEFSAAVTISNFGSLPLVIENLQLISSQGEMLADSIVPSLPNEIAGNSSTVYEFYTSIPLTYNTEMTRFQASFSGFYNQQTISDESDYLDSLRVLSQQEATYVDNSITPATLTRGENYDLRLQLKNLGDAVISLNTNSFLRFASETDTFKASLAIPTFLPDNGADVNLFFDDTMVPDGMASAKYSVDLFLSGLQGGSNYSEELALTDSILIQSPPSLSFVKGSLQPDSVFRGSQMDPVLQLLNSGEAEFTIDSDLSRLELSSEGRRIIFRPLNNEVLSLQNGEIVRFETGRIPSDFPVSGNSLSLHLEGTANEHNHTFDLQLGSDLLTILKQGAIQIITTSNLGPNSPRVNTGQHFTISVKVKNFGQETLEDIGIILIPEVSTVENDSLGIAMLDPDQTDSVVFDIIAFDNSEPAEIFRAEVKTATGSVTEAPGIIMNPEDNTAVATIQTPALLTTFLEIVSPPDALAGNVNINQQFSVQAVIENLGESEAGIGVARLVMPDGFTTSDDIDKAFEIGDPLTWIIKAPGSSTIGEIVAEIYSTPDDLNTEQPALMEKSSDTVGVAVEEQLPIVTVESQFESYDLVHSGQSLQLLQLVFSTPDQSEGAQAVIAGASFEFSDREGLAFDLGNLLLSATISDGQSQYNGTISSNQLSFDFGENIIITPLAPASLDLELVLAENTTLPNFSISQDSTMIQALDYRFNIMGSTLQVRDSDGGGFAIEKSYGLVQSDFEQSFYNIPNPFNPDNESTQIVYYLPVNSDVELKIFTLIGEEVFTTNIASGSPGAQGGVVNRIYWDGKNGNNLGVLEGVYLAVLKYSGGEARTKIAVVK